MLFFLSRSVMVDDSQFVLELSVDTLASIESLISTPVTVRNTRASRGKEMSVMEEMSFF